MKHLLHCLVAKFCIDCITCLLSLGTLIKNQCPNVKNIKTPQDVLARKTRKNAQSRSRAALLREKVDLIKSKEELNVDEKRLCQAVEERRLRKNNRSRDRALEKKAQLEMIMCKKASERTPEEVEIWNVAMAAKRRKNEGDRLRRKQLRNMGLRKKPPGVSVRGRPRKPLSGEQLVPAPYGVPSMPVQPPDAAGVTAVGSPQQRLQQLQHGRGGPETVFQYPPPAIQHAYPPHNPYFIEPLPMKVDNVARGQAQNVDRDNPAFQEERPESANSLSLEEEDGHVDLDLEGETDLVQC